MYRQGDVLLVPVNESSFEGAQALARENGRLILAEGEATGHAHAIDDAEATMFAANDNVYLRVGARPAVLRHEEHAPITLPSGLYRVIRQREYTPDQNRHVAD